MMSPRCRFTSAVVLALTTAGAFGWLVPPSSAVNPRLQPDPPRATVEGGGGDAADIAASASAAAADDEEEEVEEIGWDDKTDGIPNDFLKTEGTLKRLAEGVDSCISVDDDGALYDADREFAIVTTDVMDVVRDQVGTEGVDYLGENILVEGMYFDSFRVGYRFKIVGEDGGEEDGDVVLLEIVEAQEGSSLNLSQMADDERGQQNRQALVNLLGVAPGLAGWKAKVIEPGRIRTGFKIQKLP